MREARMTKKNKEDTINETFADKNENGPEWYFRAEFRLNNEWEWLLIVGGQIALVVEWIVDQQAISYFHLQCGWC